MVNHLVVHTGQNYDFELSEVFFDDLKLRRPDFFFSSSGLSGDCWQLLNRLKYWSESPTLCLYWAIPTVAWCLRGKATADTCISHGGGKSSYDIRVPEETRRLIDHISDINLPYTKIARNTCWLKVFTRKKLLLLVHGCEVITPLLPAIKESRY